MQIKCLHFHELSLEELYQIMALRQEVFIVEQDCPYLDADGKDQGSWHMMGFDDQSQLIAYTRLVPKGISYNDYPSIGRVVTAKSARGTGAGKKIMTHSIDWLQKKIGQEPIKISAQCYLLKFYNALGFNAIGEEYLEDNIPHIAMILNP